MTQLDILKRAYACALEDWNKWNDRRQHAPKSPYHIARCSIAKEEMDEIYGLLLSEEQKEATIKPANRLTHWNGKKWVLPQGRTSDGESYWRIIAERLAAYENTGLEPDEIMILKEQNNGIL